MQKRAEKSSRATEQMADKLDELQGKDYTNNLEDIQAAGELTAESSEQSLQEHREQTRTLKDIMAAAELNAENTESSNQKLNDLNANVVQGFEKISEFAQQIRDSLKAMPAAPTPPALPEEPKPEENLPTEEPAPHRPENMAEYLRLLAGNLVDFFKPKSEEEKPKPKPGDDTSTKFDLVLDRLDGLAKITQKGFNKTIGLADDIASALFKFTVSAMLNTAKLAAMVFGIVLIADILTIHFNHWTKMFNENFSKFEKELGSFAAPLTDIWSSLKDIYNYWKQGEYGKMVDEIGQSVANASKYLFDALLLGLGKALASLIRAMGKDELADDFETATVMRANREMGYKLSEEEEKMVARTYDRQDKEKREAIEKKRDRIGGGFNYSVMGQTDKQREEDNKTLQETLATGKQRLEGEKLENSLKGLSDDIKANDTDLKMNEIFAGKLDDLKLAIQDDLKAGKLTEKQAADLQQKASEVELLKEVQAQKIAQNTTAVEKPKEAAPDADMTRVKNIETAEKAKEAPQQTQQTNVNQNTSVVKQNNQTVVMAPQTSRDAPGLGNKL